MFMIIRRALRVLLLRLAAWLEDAPEGPPPVMLTGGGPPAHWLEKVRKAAPQFAASVSPAPSSDASAPAPRRVVARVGVPRGVDEKTARAALTGEGQLSGERGAPASPPAGPGASRSRARDVALNAPRAVFRYDTTAPAPVQDEGSRVPAAAGRRLLSRRDAGAPHVPSAARHAPDGTPASSPAEQGASRSRLRVVFRYDATEPVPVAPLSAREAGVPDVRWPDLVEHDTPPTWPSLPEDESTIDSLDDAAHLQRIDDEQRGSGWSE